MLIRRPSRGDPVREVQEALNAFGFGPLTEDGVFGRGTEQAVRKFQSHFGLTVDGVVGPTTLAALQKSKRETDHVDGEPSILLAMDKLGYSIHRDGQVNIVGVRSGTDESNSFDDEIHLVWKDGDSWRCRSYPCTTDPGLYWLEHPTRSDGTAILVPGQYPVYKWDKHQGKYETLCKRAGKVNVWRDDNEDNKLDFGEDWDDGAEGWYGINIHHAGVSSTQVGRWSAGCQVFARLADWKEAMKICKLSGADLFTYTLLEESDLEA